MVKIKDNLRIIIPIIVLVIVTIIGGIYYFSLKDDSNKKEIDIIKTNNKVSDEEKDDTIEEKKYFFVDIKGCVNNPGVYKVEDTYRVIDVINQAGGLTENADTSILNLSKKVNDEMFIIIYSKEEIEKYKSENISTKKINEEIHSQIVNIDDNNDAQIKSEEQEDNSKININTASKDELLSISGIGESKASSIIEYREKNGNFESIESLKNVSGIGDALFEKIKEYITV